MVNLSLIATEGMFAVLKAGIYTQQHIKSLEESKCRKTRKFRFYILTPELNMKTRLQVSFFATHG